ncbi:response regulator transcription factor [Enterococcus gilvus]|uniref:HTH luxR-type domain-containing protein n=1 Tax=Enterococcus gilvus ATCC BAA-350 TaxID=1158614 RepID=R2XZH0_9ENTE|nr:helix-turn-helix transcriptional regulator [Enterococcus gilvus]EOI55437.1 hypothetical protein UKC_02645 [Enterococcus gilvus ATCC BAA-350]EOW82020.1 hypothetical protein I592_01321 [Enterococcus gilvus ATCC BAA-350]OJG43049.1 hypothetical protein RV02_GL002969 [Enterococcus gilvus]
MDVDKNEQTDFFSEISEYQINAREFFSTTLLEYLEKNFGWDRVLISYYDTEGRFLSWTNWEGQSVNDKDHPYRTFVEEDKIKQQVFNEAIKDHLTYFDVTPRLYKSTDVLGLDGYQESSYVRFIEKNFEQHYSVTMAFGINAYIQVIFFKNSAEGDFTKQEIKELRGIYVYLANSYKNFKKYEQSKIIQTIQNKIIVSGEKAYLITDDFTNVMSYSQAAIDYLKDILGSTAIDQISDTEPCSWLPFLLGEEKPNSSTAVRTRIVHNLVFKIYNYDQTYSNGIIDRYHWITISKKEEQNFSKELNDNLPLTKTEFKIAELLCKGLTYKDIANKLVISYHTVKKHVQNIYCKCKVNSRYELSQLFDSKK